MKILVLGKSGQLGAVLEKSLAVLGQVVALDRSAADFSDPPSLRAAVAAVKPHLIVNAAAWTAVDRAEDERDAAFKVNAEAPRILAEAAAGQGAWLVHYSTDYVFSGSGNAPWRESEAPSPLNVYGESKLAGERAIQHAGCRHLIFRTSWVYSAHGRNFLKTMLKLAAERQSLSVVADQVGAPTGVDLLSEMTIHALHRAMAVPTLQGLYHLCAAGETSWYDYARYIFSTSRQCGAPLKLREVVPVASAAFPTRAQRPLNSRLDTTKFRQAFATSLPPWQAGVERVIADLLQGPAT
jgi:dTDP-4-dehydrorhamnose reductase